VILNDRASIEVYGERMTKPPHVKPPVAPVLYFKPYNTHVGHHAVVGLPPGAKQVEIGATLGIVFGATCSRASVDTALSFVADTRLRSICRCRKRTCTGRRSWEKCFDHSCPLGPWIVDREDVADPGLLSLRTYVNGELRHTRSTGDLVRPVPLLIADITEFMSFYAGDVLLVGYPLTVPTAGAGDAIAVECDELGRLECRLTAAIGAAQ
jgi:5-oxopent-3-ene-1,2,5-tricarboxylate decarboxylase/2-hydroxyhepta-2,4-diene-1,7-dioate isomerase